MVKGEAIIVPMENGLSVSYEDYEVECFGGADYETNYTLDRENTEKLRAALSRENRSGTLEEMIIGHFGIHLDQDSFADYCNRNAIRYELFAWIS